ncbi:hypothetical protein [Virgibacillus ainsalahensis]
MTEKKGYLLLTNTGTLFTKLIKLYTKKTYNHASIAFESDLSEVYSFGRKSIRNPFFGGFVKEDMKSNLFKQAECAIYSFEVTEEQMKDMKHYIQEIKAEKEKYRYNLLGLFGFIFHKPIKRKRAFFCSQFVASVLKECNIIDFEKPLSLIAPNDLLKGPKIKLVYEGNLKAYHNNSAGEKERVPVHFMPAEM